MKYEKPEMEMLLLDIEDIVRTSTLTDIVGEDIDDGFDI